MVPIGNEVDGDDSLNDCVNIMASVYIPNTVDACLSGPVIKNPIYFHYLVYSIHIQ